MNILVFSWRDLKHPLAGGAEQVDHEHHKGWIKAGHKVTLFSSSFPGANKKDVIDDVEIIRKGNQILGVHLNAFLWYLLNRNKFEFVIDEFHGIPFFTPFYVKKPKLGVLQEVAREVWLKNDLHWPLNYIVGYLGYFLEPLIFMPYKNVQFMVGSKSAKDELSKIGINKDHINIIPHGVILFKPTAIKKEKTKTIVFLGALAKDKGIEDAIKTFAILNKKSNYKFWIIGKGGLDYVSYLKNKCSEFGIDKKTKFWGFVSQKQKFSLLSKAHIMINPSLLEGFGLVNIEANSVKTPVLAYNSPGLSDSVKDGISGVIVQENSPEELAAEVEKLIKDETRYKNLQTNALKFSKEFDWNKSKKMSLALIRKIILQ